MDKDRVSAGHLDVHVAAGVDVHDVGSQRGTGSTGDGRGRAGVVVQAEPNDFGAGDMLQTYLTYSFITSRGAAAHDQHRSVGGQRNRRAVR